MINIIIFSKDRACQVDLCIRSIYDNFEYPYDITLQYTYSNDEFKKGFDELQAMHPDVTFVEEVEFQKTFQNLANRCKGEYILCLTDDDIIINKVDCVELDKLLLLYNYDNMIHSVSLRMNPTVTYCYPAKTDILPPQLTMKSFYFYWNWTEAPNQHYCWGYPMAIDGHIYKVPWFQERIKNLQFNNVNQLEDALNNNRDHGKPLLVSFNQSKHFNVQNNFVQGHRIDEVHNDYSVEELNKKFLDDYQISTENLYGFQKQQVHGPLDYKLVK
jgi:hypothetical protein